MADLEQLTWEIAAKNTSSKLFLESLHKLRLLEKLFLCDIKGMSIFLN